MGNPITNELPASLDNFLQDMCQMYCDMNYTDASKFAKRATPEDIKALRKLYKKFKEVAEYDDEDEIAEIAVSVEDLVKGKGLKESFEDDYGDEEDPFAAEKEGNPYIVGNCSLCGANGTDTVENFLKKYGFEDIDYSCDILDIDPQEEVCEECFKSWLPELNDRTYSEYNDLGTDTRTGLPFGEPFDESKKKIKKAVKESVKKGGKKPLKESHEWGDFNKFKNTDEYLPVHGDGDNKGTQAATALSKLIYKWFNDGDVFDNTYGLTGWANDISGSANWLYYYVPETQPILNRIKEIGSDEDAYTDLLYDLIALVDPQIPALATFPKEGDAYDEDGPFEFQEYQEEEEDYEDDFDPWAEDEEDEE